MVSKRAMKRVMPKVTPIGKITGGDPLVLPNNSGQHPSFTGRKIDLYYDWTGREGEPILKIKTPEGGTWNTDFAGLLDIRSGDEGARLIQGYNTKRQDYGKDRNVFTVTTLGNMSIFGDMELYCLEPSHPDSQYPLGGKIVTNRGDLVLYPNRETGAANKGEVRIDQDDDSVGLRIDSEATTQPGLSVDMASGAYIGMTTNGIISGASIYANEAILTGGTIQDHPTEPFDIVHKEYVDNISLGTSFDFYAYDDTSDIGTYKEFKLTPSPDAKVEGMVEIPGNATAQSVGVRITEDTINFKELVTTLTAGLWNFHVHMKAATNLRLKFYAELYIRAAGGTETLISTSETSDFLTTTEAEYEAHGEITESVTLVAGDRLVVKGYASNASPAATNFYAYVEGETATRVTIPGLTSPVHHEALINLNWADAGHTIDTTLDMNTQDITEVKDIIFQTGADRTIGIPETGGTDGDSLNIHAGDADTGASQDDGGSINLYGGLDNGGAGVEGDVNLGWTGAAIRGKTNIKGALTIGGATIASSTITSTGYRINDSATVIAEDGSSNMTFTDAVTGTKTLAQLATAAGDNYWVSGANVVYPQSNVQTISGAGIQTNGTISGAHANLTGDNSSADTAYVPMVLYNTDATPPAASGFPIGTLYMQYTA